jgi:hypothetical protein
MGLFDKLFTKDREVGTEFYVCSHASLRPRWDSVNDIGHDDRATSFVCESCQESFTPEQAQALRSITFPSINRS